MSAADPSTNANPFAERLSFALANSPLSLTRIRARLLEQGLAVSTATLSYWSSGRSVPSRGSSLLVVQELERILEVPPGTLLDALPHLTGGSSTAFLGREEVIRAAIAEHGLLTSVGWKFLMLYRGVLVGPDGANKRTTTRQVMKATTSGLRGWTNVYDRHAAPVAVESVTGVHVNRDIELDQGLRAVEFVFDQPVGRGEAVMATTVLAHDWAGDVSTSEGIGLPRPVDLLVQELTFLGEPPAAVHRRFRANDEDDYSLVDVPVRLSNQVAQMTIAQAAPGLHDLYWEW